MLHGGKRSAEGLNRCCMFQTQSTHVQTQFQSQDVPRHVPLNNEFLMSSVKFSPGETGRETGNMIPMTVYSPSH